MIQNRRNTFRSQSSGHHSRGSDASGDMLPGMDPAPPPDATDVAHDLGLITWAARQADLMLNGMGNRWRHVQGVAAKAQIVGEAFEGEDREHLVAGAHLHDIGYAPVLHVTGLHQLDGALYLRSLGHERLAALVAHHSEARFELKLRGYGSALDKYRREASSVSAALVYCDLTTGPTGLPMTLDDRLSEVYERYGPDSLVSEALRQATPHLRAAVDATEILLRRRGLMR
jgi:hypothetical protein